MRVFKCSLLLLICLMMLEKMVVRCQFNPADVVDDIPEDVVDDATDVVTDETTDDTAEEVADEVVDTVEESDIVTDEIDEI